jgi:hypothetical protein
MDKKQQPVTVFFDQTSLQLLMKNHRLDRGMIEDGFWSHGNPFSDLDWGFYYPIYWGL